MLSVVLLLLAVPSQVGWAAGDDWPTYQHDNARSGIARESLPRPLALDWVIRPPFPPARGWGEPESTPVYEYGIPRIPKVNYDDAYHVAIADGGLFYCASAENHVRRADPVTGQTRWTVITDAAPRLAPTLWHGRVYVGADDGLVRCLDAATGKRIWDFHAAPAEDRALSQDRLVSLWPVRTGVIVQDDIAYFGAGLFPAEGLRLYAVNAATGTLIWKNDAFDDGGTANISPQGYLLADRQHLVLPAGRVCPTVFDLASGRFLFHVEDGRALTGGSYALLTPRYLYTGTQMVGAYDLTQPRADKWGHAIRGWQVCSWFNARRIIVQHGTVYLATPTEVLAMSEDDLPAATAEVDRVRKLRWEHRNPLAAYQRAKELLDAAPAGSSGAARSQAEMDRQQNHVRLVAEAETKLHAYLNHACRWRLPCQASEALILAGNSLYAGGDGRVVTIDAERGKQLEEHAVEGTVRGLAAAQGRLFVSTTTGGIYGFHAATAPAASIETSAKAAAALAGRESAASAAREGDAPVRREGEAPAEPWRPPDVGPSRLRGSVALPATPVATPATDVATPATDVATPATDDATPATDDATPATAVAIPATDVAATKAELAAREILRASGVDKGHCLLLGGGDGAVAWALAQHSALRIYVLEDDPRQAEAARRRLSDAGCYGGRVVVEQGDLISRHFPPYFANLIVDVGAGPAGVPPAPAEELLRILKPHGGVALVRCGREDAVPAVPKPPSGSAGASPSQGISPSPVIVDPAGPEAIGKWLTVLQDGSLRIERHEGWAKITRGALPGVGWWTHQYADAGNTSCSRDALVRTPLRPLWFGDPGPQGLLDRHAAGPAPLCSDGRLFVQGDDRIAAWDAYNGLALWQRNLAGATRIAMTDQSSNMAAAADSLFVVANDGCLRLDALTGETRRTYVLPPRADGAPRRWGWLAVAGQQLFGSRTDTERPFRNWPTTTGHASEAVFCLDVDSGRVRWSYEGQSLPPTALAVGGGAVFLLDAELSDEERRQALAETARLDRPVAAPDRPQERTSPTPDRRGEIPARLASKVVALDARTGQRRWSRPLEITDLVVAPRGGQPNLIFAGDTLLVCSSPSGGDHHLKEFQDGQFARRTLIALSADSGQVRWAGPKNYLSRPVVIGDLIYAQPWAYDLATGQPKLRPHPLTGELQPWCVHRGAGGACGAISASAETMFFRSDAGACYDLQADQGITRRGGQRWGCWINAIAAGGLLLVPEGSAECDCPYALQCTTVLVPRPGRPAWAQFDLPPPLVPVQHLAIALGAPGDVRDRTGQLWLSCPHRAQKHHWAACRFSAGEGNGYAFDPDRIDHISGSDRPWLFASAARGLLQFTVPLTAGPQAGVYTVRLGFAETDAVEVGDRVFEVLLQGERVLGDFDVVRESGGRNVALVKEFHGVRISGSLNIEFRPSAQARRPQAILSTVEAIREVPGVE